MKSTVYLQDTNLGQLPWYLLMLTHSKKIYIFFSDIQNLKQTFRVKHSVKITTFYYSFI